jgi:hypothetical protein
VQQCVVDVLGHLEMNHMRGCVYCGTLNTISISTVKMHTLDICGTFEVAMAHEI